MLKRWLQRGTFFALAVLLLIQLIPYGRSHPNPAVNAEPAWSQPEIRRLVEAACFDCHSNQTRWPWYSHVAPVSWVVYRDTVKGRQALNFSEWGGAQLEAASEAAESVLEGEMPPALYLLGHPEARLSPADRQRLIDGLRATFGADHHEHDQDHGEHVGAIYR